MQHQASISTNASSIKLAQGDTLTLSLPYETGEGGKTLWTFEDDFSFNSNLSLGKMETDDGVYAVHFTATRPGTCRISLAKVSAYRLPGSNETLSTFKLTVEVK